MKKQAQIPMSIRNQTIVKRRKQGYTFDEIAHDYGLTRQRIQQIYKDTILGVDKSIGNIIKYK